jgi:hypothetical protein
LNNVYINLSEVSIVSIVISTKGLRWKGHVEVLEEIRNKYRTFVDYLLEFLHLNSKMGGSVANNEMHFWETSFENPSWMELVAFWS